MKHVLVPCSCCEGTGRAKLSEVLQQTLDVVPRRGFMSTLEIARRVGDPDVKPTAINNRLSLWLRPMGLVQVERRGKALFWKRIK